jgi:hypothetical protein
MRCDLTIDLLPDANAENRFYRADAESVAIGFGLTSASGLTF